MSASSADDVLQQVALAVFGVALTAFVGLALTRKEDDVGDMAAGGQPLPVFGLNCSKLSLSEAKKGPRKRVAKAKPAKAAPQPVDEEQHAGDGDLVLVEEPASAPVPEEEEEVAPAVAAQAPAVPAKKGKKSAKQAAEPAPAAVARLAAVAQPTLQMTTSPEQQALQAEIKKIQKKVREITDLKARQAEGEALQEGQLAKIAMAPALNEQLQKNQADLEALRADPGIPTPGSGEMVEEVVAEDLHFPEAEVEAEEQGEVEEEQRSNEEDQKDELAPQAKDRKNKKNKSQRKQAQKQRDEEEAEAAAAAAAAAKATKAAAAAAAAAAEAEEEDEAEEEEEEEEGAQGEDAADEEDDEEEAAEEDAAAEDADNDEEAEAAAEEADEQEDEAADEAAAEDEEGEAATNGDADGGDSQDETSEGSEDKEAAAAATGEDETAEEKAEVAVAAEAEVEVEAEAEAVADAGKDAGEAAVAEGVADEGAKEGAKDAAPVRESRPKPQYPLTEREKELMKLKKKLREVADLESKKVQGLKIALNQEAKIEKKAELEEQLASWEKAREPHTVVWDAVVEEVQNPAFGVLLRLDGQPEPLTMHAAYMDPPAPAETLPEVAQKYTKGQELKVRIMRNGKDVTEMSVEDEDYYYQDSIEILAAVNQLKEADDKMVEEIWNSGKWSRDEYQGVVTSIKDQCIFVRIHGARDIRVSADQLLSEMRYRDPVSEVFKTNRDNITAGQNVEGVRLSYDYKYNFIRGTMLEGM